MLMNYPNAVPSLADLYEPIRADLNEVRRIFDEEVHSDLPFVNELVGTVLLRDDEHTGVLAGEVLRNRN